ncbi:MAG TPA: hypothetical protein VKH35_13405, partial [Thermoanaerobaculia bacterium]|nr:hypothetical protein [Thermoanaerobaculia bacterium]
VRANLVARPEDCRWTSYRATAGLSPAPQWLAFDDLLVHFGPDRHYARAGYQSFVEAAIGLKNEGWKRFAHNSYLGSKTWFAEVQDRIDLKPRSREFPLEQRAVGAAPMSEVVAAVAEHFAVDEVRIRSGLERRSRMVAAWIGWNEALLTGTAIAEDLRLSSSYVSALVRRCDREIGRDSDFRAAVDASLSTFRRKSRITDLTPFRG